MKIAVAQIQPISGNIERNIEIHQKWIEAAASASADFIFFSELSLTGYETEFIKAFTFEEEDERFQVFQEFSNSHKIVIAVGAPIKTDLGAYISMLFFQPNKSKELYYKQQLHADELPYFVQGNKELLLTIQGKKITPAICYESIQESPCDFGAEIYIVSVAKDEKGIENGYIHYAEMARKYKMPVLMSNCFGFCDNFHANGQSAIWNSEGILKGKLESDQEGILMYDTKLDAIESLS